MFLSPLRDIILEMIIGGEREKTTLFYGEEEYFWERRKRRGSSGCRACRVSRRLVQCVHGMHDW